MSALEAGGAWDGQAAVANDAADGWLDRLVAHGWSVCDGAVAPALAAALREETVRLHAARAFYRAGVGRANDHALIRDVRQDKVSWLNGSTLAQVQYLAAMEQLRLDVNATLFLGLFGFEAHFAVYEPGGFYVRHVDAFRGARNRVLSTVLYLNPNWCAGDGGELAVYPREADDNSVVTDAPEALIAPLSGRLAVFLSEEIPHEVRVACVDRYSIAGWFRVREG